MPKNNIALVDMDGTIADYNFAMQSAMKDILGPEEHMGEINLNCGNTSNYEKVRRKLIRSQPGFWTGLKKITSGMKVLDVFKELEFNIHILTKGPKSCPGAWTEKVEWCHDQLADYEYAMHITSDKGLMYGKILFDDYPPYLEAWLRWRPRGLAIMPANPWNEKFTHPQVIRYTNSNFDEVVSAIKKARDR